MKKQILALLLAGAAAGVACAGEAWLPGKIQSYSPDASTNEWALSGTTTYEYDEQGRVISETQERGWRYEYTYTEAGQIASKTSLVPAGSTFVPQYRNVYEYDPIVPSFVVSDSSEHFDGLKWEILGVTRYIVKRNDAGNVTGLYYQNLCDEESGWSPEGCSYRVEYNDEGIATDIIRCEEVEMDYWDEVSRFSDIVWENTDGQILISRAEIKNSEFYTGNNRLKSCTVSGELDADIVVNGAYSGDADYEMTAMMGETELFKQSHKALGENNSYEYYNKTTNTYGGRVGTVQILFGKIVYDAFGIETESTRHSSFQYTPSEEPTDGVLYSKTEVSYDDATGFPVETVESRASDGEEWTLYQRKVYSDFQDPAGFAAPVIEDNASEAWFDLMGRPVAKPSSGFYIRRCGSAASKVLLR